MMSSKLKREGKMKKVKNTRKQCLDRRQGLMTEIIISC